MKHNKLIYKDNKIINASYKVTLNELRLLLLAISRINSFDKLTRNTIVTITASEYSSWFGGEKREVYRDMKIALDLLFQRTINIIDTEEQITTIRWITLKSKNHLNHAVELRFTEEVANFLSDFTGEFTKYKLENIKDMKSIFSIRIYELLMQWKKTGIVKITVSELRYRLQINSKGYPKFGNIRQKILDPAIEEINQTSDIIAKYSVSKKGKTVDAIIFNFVFKDISKAKIENDEQAKNSIEYLKETLK